jgi:NAD+ kinase
VRLDQLLVERGFFPSREQARRAVMAGTVEVEGRRVDKPGTAVVADARLAVAAGREPYASRAGRKLAAALDHFAVDPAGWVCLDVGASTGGFTDCLLQRRAARVYALDVGYGQLDQRLRNDPRVVVMERVNARHLAPDALPESCRLATVDVSFISLRKIVPALVPHLVPGGLLLALIKPQFEAGRRGQRRHPARRIPAPPSDPRLCRGPRESPAAGRGRAAAPCSLLWRAAEPGALGDIRLPGCRQRRQPRGLRSAAAGRAMSRRRKLQRIGVVAKVASREAVDAAGELAEWLIRRGLSVALDSATIAAIAAKSSAAETFEPGAAYDLVIVLGGDGTLLAVARGLGDGVPILGVNLGNLGFLTEINRGELYAAMVQVLAGKFDVEARKLLDVELRRRGDGPLRYRVFNDAVITKSALSRIIELTLEVDGHLIARYRSDGLIISSPTGSTAYNLSAGGPILNPLLPVTVLTPICPHALSLRPIVVPGASLVEVTLETQREEVFLTLDGQEGTAIGYHDTVAVTRSSAAVHLVKVSERSFYDSLREKLRWGGLHPPPEGRTP